MDFTDINVSHILDVRKHCVRGERNYRILHESFLQKLWDKMTNHQSYFTLIISRENLNKADFREMNNNMERIRSVTGCNNLIWIDKDGSIIQSEFIDSKEDDLLRYSYNKNFVFFFGEEDVTCFYDGQKIEGNNLFYSSSDRKKYNKKKDISKLHEVISDYSRQYLTVQVNYMAFFADKNTLQLMGFDDEGVKRNILKNKPEKLMQQNLQQYLNAHMQYNFLREDELLQSKKRLDLFFDVFGEMHLIEIKWIGAALTALDNDLSNVGKLTEYDLTRVKEGVVQALEYIEELSNTEDVSIRRGYLAVFDARDDKNPAVNETEIRDVPNGLNEYLDRFEILPIIELNKGHIA